jgi:hypothetical protein
MAKHGPKRRRAAIDDLQRFADSNFDVRSPGPRPSTAKPRQPRRTITKVAADEAAIEAIRPNGTRQRFQIDGVARLFLRVEPNGSKSYQIVRHTRGQAGRACAGRSRGAVGEVSLREAILGVQIAELKWRVSELETELRAARSARPE